MESVFVYLCWNCFEDERHSEVLIESSWIE